MNIVSKTRKTVIAAVAALAVVSAGAVVAPSQAHANNLAGAFVGGLIVGGIVAATQPTYYNPAPVYRPVYRSCWNQWQTRYNSYGQPYSVKVRVCN